ncbi:MAG: orotate phosphoribosyltransferase [Candidatus Firestonebacteria bacterium]|nr:orotate phosphoribosyltransferase [Candidatus Firestonebacteria bacterium]
MLKNNLKESLLELIIKKSFNYSSSSIFTLASGKQSQYYFDCRPTTTDPLGQYLLGEIFFEKVSDFDISAIGGLTMGADPIAYAVCHTSYFKNKPIKAFVIRKEPKKHGLKKLIEGEVTKGEKVVIVDDVITTGGSTIKAINEARNAGLNVVKAVVLIDRQEGGKDNIEKLDVKVESIFTKDEVFEAYKIIL